MAPSVASLATHAAQWTLDDDKALLDVCQAIANDINAKAAQCSNTLDLLLADVDDTAVALENCYGRLRLLANNQFMEHVRQGKNKT